MSKKNLGILEQIKIESKEDKSKSVKEQKSKRVKDNDSKAVKKVKSERLKRSFMLDEESIKKLNLLDIVLTDKDLSAIVSESINLYFQKNKKSVDAFIDNYKNI